MEYDTMYLYTFRCLEVGTVLHIPSNIAAGLKDAHDFYA